MVDGVGADLGKWGGGGWEVRGVKENWTVFFKRKIQGGRKFQGMGMQLSCRAFP